MTARAMLAALVLLATGAAPAQGVRVTGTTVARFIDVRPFVEDSISVDSTSGTGTYRAATNGLIVRCDASDAFCHFLRSSTAVTAAPITQDVEISAWGLGEGVQLYAQLRGRASVGASQDIWPRSGDHFDALAAYLQVDRWKLRGRLGRQWAQSGLGFYNYDGLSVRWRALRWLTAELYGGESLVRGLNEGYTSSEIAAVENLPPDKNAWLLGADVRVRPSPSTAFSALYQRELRFDRFGLYSERIALDGQTRAGIVSLTGEMQLDLSQNDVNLGQVRAHLPLSASTGVSATFRRYRPFFELWTIWGAFSPVGYKEGTLAGYWSAPGDVLGVQLSGGYRHYDAADAGVAFAPLKTTGWRVGADGSWRPSSVLTVSGGYHYDLGFGASQSDGSLGVRWEPSDRAFVGITGSAFQSVYEFRIGTGRVVGGSIDAGARITSSLRLVGDVGVYRNLYGDHAPQTDWSQTRGSLRLEWTLGDDPGMPRSPRGGGTP